MTSRDPLNLFYDEPDPDRWVPFDHYPRRFIRRLLRGPAQAGGQMRVFLNLVAGLDRLGVPYRTNDYRYVRAHPGDLVCLVGKPHLLEKFGQDTPLMFGTSIYNHPIDDEMLPTHHTIRQILVPSAWVQRMFSQTWPGLVTAWPVGIDTDRWTPAPTRAKDIDVVFYDKIFRNRVRHEAAVIDPLLDELRRRGLVVEHLSYGSYVEEQLHDLSRRAKSMVYLSRHETQGIALQQMLSAGVPAFAWDPGGEWPSLEYLLRGIHFGPVTSVPYWDDCCGVRFEGPADMIAKFDVFWRGVRAGAYAPRQMILDQNLTLEGCAQAYVDLASKYAP